MQIIIQFIPQIAQQLSTFLQTKTKSPEIEPILNTADQFKVAFRLLHPGTNDPTLRLYFTVEPIRKENIDQLLSQLEKLSEVTAAYAKPLDELP